MWSEQGAALRLRILPPWWATWWFRSLCAFVFLALLDAAYQTRVQRLRRGFKQLRDVVETIPAMAWTARPDGTHEFVNKRWTEFTGLSAEDTAGSGWMAAVHPEDRQILLDKWHASLDTGEPLEFEARVRSAATGINYYRAAGFQVRHVPWSDPAHAGYANFADEVKENRPLLLAAYDELPKPVLVHCSAAIDRSPPVIAYVVSERNPPQSCLLQDVLNAGLILALLLAPSPEVVLVDRTFGFFAREQPDAGRVGFQPRLQVCLHARRDGDGSITFGRLWRIDFSAIQALRDHEVVVVGVLALSARSSPGLALVNSALRRSLSRSVNPGSRGSSPLRIS